MATRVTDGARRERHEKERLLVVYFGTFLSVRLIEVCKNCALVSRVSRLCRSRSRALLSLNLRKRETARSLVPKVSA